MAKTKTTAAKTSLTAAPADPLPPIDVTPPDAPPVVAKQPPVLRPAVATAIAEPLITVEDLLARSAQHHEGYRQALLTNRPVDVQTYLQLALDAREAAQALDPTFLDPAWTAHEATHPHLQLLTFYRQQVQS